MEVTDKNTNTLGDRNTLGDDNTLGDRNTLGDDNTLGDWIRLKFLVVHSLNLCTAYYFRKYRKLIMQLLNIVVGLFFALILLMGIVLKILETLANTGWLEIPNKTKDTHDKATIQKPD